MRSQRANLPEVQEAKIHTDKQLFIRDFEKLKEVIAKADHYEILSSAAILRKFFIDGSPLVTQVNIDLKYKIKFEVLASSQPGFDDGYPKDPVLAFFDFVPYNSSPALEKSVAENENLRSMISTVEVSRDRFLATRVAVSNGVSFSIGDAIDHAANSAGAVHYGEPNSDKIRHLRELSKLVLVGDQPFTLNVIFAAVSVVIKALQPIYDVLKASGEDYVPSPWPLFEEP